MKARVRFINDCDGSVMQSVALKPLQQAYQTSSGMSLWGPDPSGTAASVAPGTVSLATPSTVPVPNTSPICNGNSERDYTPIRRRGPSGGTPRHRHLRFGVVQHAAEHDVRRLLLEHQPAEGLPAGQRPLRRPAADPQRHAQPERCEPVRHGSVLLATRHARRLHLRRERLHGLGVASDTERDLHCHDSGGQRRDAQPRRTHAAGDMDRDAGAHQRARRGQRPRALDVSAHERILGSWRTLGLH